MSLVFVSIRRSLTDFPFAFLWQHTLQIAMTALSDMDKAFLLVVISVCLGACFVAVFWELERVRIRWWERGTHRARLSRRRRAARNRGPENPKPDIR